MDDEGSLEERIRVVIYGPADCGPFPARDLVAVPELLHPDARHFEMVDDAARADFILFPYYLDSILHRRDLQGTLLFMKALPLFAAFEHKHVFLMRDDYDCPLPVRSVLFRHSVKAGRPDINAVTLPYWVEDLSRFMGFEEIRYHLSFVGNLLSSEIRILMPLPFLPESAAARYGEILASLQAFHRRKGEKMHRDCPEPGAATEALAGLFPLERDINGFRVYLDANIDFHGFVEDASLRHRKRKRFLEILHRSLAVFCPKGSGLSSIRFFETMSAGRLPVLISDDCALPLEDEIDYSAFVLRIPEARVLDSGQIVASWLAGQPMEEIQQRCLKARSAWRVHFHPERFPLFLAKSLLKVKRSSYRLNG